MEEKISLTEQVIEGSFYGAFSNLINRAGALIFTIILARFLFPENFGIYSLTMSIALIFMTFADLGLDNILIRYFSSNLKNRDKAVAYFQYIFKLKFYLSFLISFLLLVLAYPLSFWIYKKPELFLPLVMSSLFILTSLFAYFFSSFFYAIKKVKYLAIKEILFEVMRIGLVVLVFIFLTSLYHILGILVGLILTNLVIILLLLMWINKFTPHIFKKTQEKIDKIKILKFLGYITISSITGVFLINTDILMLGFFVSFVYIGYYKVAFALIFGLTGLFSYLGSLLLSVFTNLKGERLKRALNKVLRFVLIFSTPITFGALALGKYIIKLLGDEYLPSVFPFYILSFFLIAYVPLRVIAALFYSKEKPKPVAKVTVISLILNIIFNYILISQLIKISELGAIIGAAIATITSKYFALFYLASLVKRELNIRLEKLNFLKPIIGGLIMFLSLYSLNLFIIKDMNLLIGISEVLFGAAIYFLIMFLIKGINKNDIEIFKKTPIFKKFAKKNET